MPAVSVAPFASPSRAARPDFAARVFGYDVFISFALGGPPRGSQSYASDLARRLRERGLTVFFSEEEAAPGSELDSTLRRALHRSRVLVVVANRGTLAEPRWVRQEVQSFLSLQPPRPVVPVNIGGALQDPALAEGAASWLPFRGHIWIDETQQAADGGLASDAVVERLALTPHKVSMGTRWRWLTRTVMALLALLAAGMAVAAWTASRNAQKARDELQRSATLRAAAEASARVTGQISGGHERALQQALAAHALDPDAPQVADALHAAVLGTARQLKIRDIGREIFAAAWRPGGPSGAPPELVTVSPDGSVQRWNGNTLAAIDEALPGPKAALLSVAYSPDGSSIAATGDGAQLWMWDVASGEVRTHTLPGGGGAQFSLAFLPGLRQIVTTGAGGTLWRWDEATAQPVGSEEWTTTGGDVNTTVAVSANGQRLAAGGDLGMLRAWSQKAGQLSELRLPDLQPNAMMQAAAFHPDERRLATLQVDGSLRVWDTVSGRLVHTALNAHSGGAGQLAFTPDGRRLLSAGGGGSLLAWDVADWRQAGAWLQGQGGSVMALAISADGTRAVSGGEDGLLRLWDLSELAAVPPPHTNHSELPVPKGPWLARTVPDDGLALVDGRSNAPVGAPLYGHKRPLSVANVGADRPSVKSLAVSGDGRLLASASVNGSIQLWTVQPFKPLGQQLLGHVGAVNSLAFSADGRHLASAGQDGTLRLWRTADGVPLGAAEKPGRGALQHTAFSADGQWLLSWDASGSLRRPAPAAWVATLCGKLVRNPSAQRWREWMSPEIPYRAPCPGLPVAADGQG